MGLEAMTAESYALLAGGTDTTSNTLTWFFYLVAKHPDVEQKLVDELHASGLLEGEITSEAVERLAYFEATLKEAMRLLPAIPVALMRVVPEGGAQILGHHLPGGTHVCSPMYALFRSPLVWRDCDSFVPERWLEAKPAEGFIPFLLGSRACLGKNLALAQLRLVCVHILAKYRLTLEPGQDPMQFTCRPVLKPKLDRLDVRVALRQ